MLRFSAVILGLVFIGAGICGYLPEYSKDNLLFGIFAVDNLHNVFYLVCGVIAIMCATSYGMTKGFFALIGIIFSILGIVGFYRNGDLMLTHVNFADNVLHLGIGVVSLYLGFSRRRKV